MSETDILKIEPGEQLSQPALSIKANVLEKDLPDHVEKCFQKIFSCLDEQGEKPVGPPFIAYYNIDTGNLRGNGIWDMEVGVPVSGVLPGKGEVKPAVILQGKTVSCLYKGPYPGLGKAYSELTGWIKTNNCEPLNISYEYFFNSPDEVPGEELLTRIVFLIK
jgi:effector-binding domain-containing protein